MRSYFSCLLGPSPISLLSLEERVMSSRILAFRRSFPSCWQVSTSPRFCRKLGTFTKFQDYLTSRRHQASKSLLIQITNPDHAQDVGRYLKLHFGQVESLYHYTVPKKGKSTSNSASNSVSTATVGENYYWLLAEFASKDSAEECLKTCRHPEGTIPCTMKMCWYLPPNGDNKSKSKAKLTTAPTPTTEDSIEIFNEKLETNSQMNEAIFRGKSINDQLKVLEDSTKLTELGIRLRFFLAGQLEECFQNFFPLGCVLPFGSTVSGIGRQTGDLDLVVIPDSREIFPDSENISKEEGNGLHFHAKLSAATNTSNARFQAQRVMETMADVIHLFVPGCNHVQRILQARIPILRFWSEFTDLQCDLSMTNSSGVHMSELIYLMIKIEPRFTTLLFAIRSWASARKITNPVPGKQPTNFILVLLLIYYLQRKQLLPTLDILFNNAGARDFRITADGIDCSFLRDKELILKYFTPNLGENETIAELLFEFFEFYSEFDFNRKGVSLVTGTSWGKPDAAPLYIQNPLERHLNVSRNVSKEEITRFKNECCSALWKLETSWHALNSPTDSKEKSHVSLKDVLLSPTLDSKLSSTQDLKLKMKELFNSSK